MLGLIYQYKPYLIPFCTACAVHVGIVSFYGTNDTQPAQMMLKQGCSALELTMMPSAPSAASLAAPARTQKNQSEPQPVPEPQPVQECNPVTDEPLEPLPPAELPPFPVDASLTGSLDLAGGVRWCTTPPKKSSADTTIDEPADKPEPVEKKPVDQSMQEQQNTSRETQDDRGTNSTTAPASAEQDADMQEKGVDCPSQLSSDLQVVYPRVSRKRGEEGMVRVRVRLTAEGTVADIHIARSSGYSRLDDAACDAVSAAQFVPQRKNGTPVASTLDLTIVFKLDD